MGKRIPKGGYDRARADMFYLGSYDSETNNIANVYKLYYKYVEKIEGLSVRFNQCLIYGRRFGLEFVLTN